MAWVWLHRFGSPPYFYRLARRLTPWFAWPALLLCLAGLVWGLGFTPPEAHQGDGFRIIYVHVPAAWLSVQVYMVMALSAAIGLIWRIKIAHAVAASCATVGASFTVLALGTGYGELNYGEGKYGGTQQVLVLANSGTRALSSVLQNVIDAWRRVAGLVLPALGAA